MASLNEQILRTAKEIVVKFIETGRVSPTTFPETFKNIYQTVEEAALQSQKRLESGEKDAEEEETAQTGETKKKKKKKQG
jgi:TfoX/Sxy family transcriptional regulator of competence genes